MSSSDGSPSALPQALAPVEPPVEVKAPPKEATKPSGHIIAAQAMKMEFSGPMPHPDLLGRYEQICPGSADRIIKMAEQEAEHRRSAERSIIDAQIVDMNKQHSESRCGQICALVITLAALRKPPRRDHNAGGKSAWMQGFFDRPAPPLWRSLA